MDHSISPGVRRVAQGLRERETLVTDALARAVSGCMPDLGEEAERLIADSSCANVRTLAHLLTYPQADAQLPAPPPETIAYVHLLVQRRQELDAMIHGYRVAHANLWRQCAREASTQIEDNVLLPVVLEDVSALLYGYTNTCIDKVSEEFHVARDEYLRSPIARRMDLVTRVLQGEDLELAELSMTLDYRIGGHHLGLVLERTNAEPVAAEARPLPATVAATRIARLLSPEPRLLMLPVERHNAWLWVNTGPSLENPPAAEIGRIARAAGVTVGVGEPRAGVAGFRETHFQAREAVNCSTAQRPFARYRDIALVSTLHGNRDRAIRLMHFSLGQLLGDDPTHERLRETLSTFVDSGLNVRATARALGTHHHTVAYRLRQAESLLGHKIVTHAALIRSGLLIYQLVHEDSDIFPH